MPHLRGLEFALGEAARGPLGDIREWGGVAWAKLGSCCWRQWPWYGLYNASRARRGERSPMALRVAQALPPPQLAEQAPHAILHRFAPPRMGLAFLAQCLKLGAGASSAPTQQQRPPPWDFKYR